MTEISDRYHRLADDFAEVVAAVPDDKWSAPSPCEGWTARDVVRHVVETQGMFMGLVGRTMPEGPSVDEDPVAAFDHARRCVERDLAEPDLATAEFEGMFGRRTFESAVDQFLSGDLAIHRWDLATAVGIEVTIAPDDIDRAWKDAELVGEAARSPSVYGPALEPPAGADEQTKLLAFTGRRAW